MFDNELKTKNNQQSDVQTKKEPFFSQEGQASFFSKSTAKPSSFFTQPTIQAKLTVGQPNDKYEKEADAMADAVVSKSSSTPQIQNRNISSIQRESLATPMEDEKLGTAEQRMEEDKLVQEKPVIQKKCTACEEKEKLQAKGENHQETASKNIEHKLNSNKGKGNALPKEVQNSMGADFGTDFSGVRVHTGSEAIQMSKELNAQAFTHGNDIYFNQGRYDTNSTSGKHLLAHELTHTVQQGNRSKTNNENLKRTIQLSPLSEEFQSIWDSGNKADFFDRLRNIERPNTDQDLIQIINSLSGDDYWLANNILQYGREINWPIHLRVEREMKGWSDSRGKGVVFDILRGANRQIASNSDLSNSLSSIFSVGSDDLWLAQTIQMNGSEPLWNDALLTERNRRARENNWPDEAGHIGATLTNSAGGRPVEAFFFPGRTNQRALVIGGVHGSELSGIEVVETLLASLITGPRPYFTVIIVPRLFPDNAALAESRPRSIGSAENVGRNTCDTDQSDCSGTNRGFPEGGHSHDSSNPLDANRNTIEAENLALLNLIERFRPTRIASVHAIRSDHRAGIYADPRTDSHGIALGYGTDEQLALEMARHARSGEANVPGNKLSETPPNAVYPRDPDTVSRGERQRRDTSAGHSLGGWGTTAICNSTDHTEDRSAMRVITVEVQGSSRVEDMDNEQEANRRRSEIEAHASALREIFLGPSIPDNLEDPCFNVTEETQAGE